MAADGPSVRRQALAHAPRDGRDRHCLGAAPQRQSRRRCGERFPGRLAQL